MQNASITESAMYAMQKKVEFIYRNMATVNEGRVDMWICKQYELSDNTKALMNNFIRPYIAESEG